MKVKSFLANTGTTENSNLDQTQVIASSNRNWVYRSDIAGSSDRSIPWEVDVNGQ